MGTLLLTRLPKKRRKMNQEKHFSKKVIRDAFWLLRHELNGKCGDCCPENILNIGHKLIILCHYVKKTLILYLL